MYRILRLLPFCWILTLLPVSIYVYILIMSRYSRTIHFCDASFSYAYLCILGRFAFSLSSSYCQRILACSFHWIRGAHSWFSQSLSPHLFSFHLLPCRSLFRALPRRQLLIALLSDSRRMIRYACISRRATRLCLSSFGELLSSLDLYQISLIASGWPHWSAHVALYISELYFAIASCCWGPSTDFPRTLFG